MKKKICFIGAGRFQVPGIIKARDMGLEVIAVDGDSGAPGLQLADCGEVLDIKNVPGVVDLSRRLAIDAVIAISSEVSMRTVAAVAQDLGLPGLTPEATRRLTNKYLMREAFDRYNVPSTDFILVRTPEEAVRAFEEIGGPIVLKPADSAGSRGVKYVSSVGEVRGGFDDAMRYSDDQQVLVESFMDGVEVSVEAFICNGKLNVLALSDKVRTLPPYLLDTTVIFPATCSGRGRDEILAVFERAIDALDFDNAPIHAEIMLTAEGPRIVEIAGRGPGFKVFTDIIPRVTGLDVVKANIELALGEQPVLAKNENRAAVLKFIEGSNGIYEKTVGLEEARNLPAVSEIEIYPTAGSPISALRSGSDRLGHIITYAPTRDGALQAVSQCEACLDIRIKKSVN
jgi:biotin carboxylase